MASRGEAEGPIQARIAGIAYAFPDGVTTNDELERAHPSWKVPQVAVQTGVERRHWCAPDETALDLAVEACAKLDRQLRGSVAQSDAILFCTQSPDHWMPPNACLLQERLGFPRTVAALDFPLACSGYVYGLYLAKALIVSGSARQVLLVTSETYSKWMHPGDRAPMMLFGDGAAASLIVSGPGLGPFAMGSDGSGANQFCVPAGAARKPRSASTSLPTTDASGNVRDEEHLVMDGPAVLDFVKREMPRFVTGFLRETGETIDTLDLVCFHQASAVALNYLNDALRIPRAKQFVNLAHIGNTVSASIPIALRQAEESGALKPGMRVLTVGFGVGLSWGAGIVTWNPDRPA